MRVVGIIPARLKSTRLTNKPLVDIEGLPMIVHVFKRAQLCPALDDIFVATDSQEIYDVVTHYGGKAIMTSGEHKTGTDRIAEAARGISAEIIVNIQGDEPLLNPEHIHQAIQPLFTDSTNQIVILVTPYGVKKSFSDIKAVLDKDDYILYCSRADLPSDSRESVKAMWKMCFMVPFRRDFLFQYASWPQTPLEKIEFNEYLRILENGYKIKAVKVTKAHISVDTPEDLAQVRELMKVDKIRFQYRN